MPRLAPTALVPLQRSAGNAAVSSLFRPSTTVQRCGPTPCGCSEEERERHAAGQRPAGDGVHGVSLQRLTAAEKLIDLSSPDYAGDARLEAAFDNAPAMRRGETGDPVAKVQRGLADDGFVMRRSVGPTGPDGKFGDETRRTVRAFQGKHGLKVDGAVGRETLGRLDELAAATGGRGRGGGSAVAGGDTGFEVRGKQPGADRQPTKLFFLEGSAVLDAAEQGKIPALATPPDRALTLRGLRSEDEDAGLAATRVQAADGSLGTAGHTGVRTPDARPDAGLGRLTYRAVRIVEVIPAGAPATTPDCAAGPVVVTPAPNAFTGANDRALQMLDNALGALAGPTPDAVAAVTALFRRASALPTVRSRLGTLRNHLAGWTAPAQHRFHNECDASCVGTIAYIDGTGIRPLTLCPIFMSEPDLDERAGTLVHEGTHREPRLDTQDHAYLFERVIAHLSDREALANADSYVALVRNLDTPGSVAVGPQQPDVAGAGITDPAELRQANQAIAFAEKWLSANDSEIGSLYSTIVESRPGNRWTNGYYEDAMRLVARRFGFTLPPALPTQDEQQAIAGIADRIVVMLRFFAAPIDFDRAADPTDPVTVGPGRRLTLSDGFFRLSAEQRVHQVITAVLQRVATIPADHQPQYQTMIEDIRRHFDAPAP